MLRLSVYLSACLSLSSSFPRCRSLSICLCLSRSICLYLSLSISAYLKLSARFLLSVCLCVTRFISARPGSPLCPCVSLSGSTINASIDMHRKQLSQTTLLKSRGLSETPVAIGTKGHPRQWSLLKVRPCPACPPKKKTPLGVWAPQAKAPSSCSQDIRPCGSVSSGWKGVRASMAPFGCMLRWHRLVTNCLCCAWSDCS